MKYTVSITREGDAWLADVPEVDGAHTYARSIDVLLKSIREVIILMDDLHEDAELDLILEHNFDNELVARAFEIGRARAELAARDAELVSATADVIQELNRNGFTVRDSARLLEMTPGRVSQIANG